jgi:uncharacterized RDD family membrane protein YckC
MDEGRESIVATRRAGAESVAAVQPGDPWGVPASRPDAPPTPRDAEALRPGGLVRRGVALGLDLVAVIVLWAAGGGLAAAVVAAAPGFVLGAQAFDLTWRIVVPGAYFVLGHGTAGQTLGKRLVGVRVVDVRGAPIGYVHALGRLLATAAAAGPLGVGLALAGWRADRRGLHDLLAGTRVVRL